MKTDVAVVGGGPAGAMTALFLAQKGISTTVVEKASFPRFHIGESLTGSAGALLRKAGLDLEMSTRDFPVKHGVNVWGPEGKNEFYVPVVEKLPDGERRKATTWQVRRSDFDKLLLDKAVEAGATVVDASAKAPVFDDDGWASGVDIDVDGERQRIQSDVLVDASGQSCFLSKAGVTSEKVRGGYQAQIAIFTHVTGADRGDREERDNTVIVYKEPGHWAWFIPVDSETTSVGVVVSSAYFKSKGETTQEFLEREFTDLNPELTWRLADATIAIEPHTISNYSYRIEEYTGPGWLCVGDSHQFIDPVFSFGVHFALHEGWKAADHIADCLQAPTRRRDAFSEFQEWSGAGQAIIRDLVDAFWGQPFAFGYLTHRKHVDDMVDLFAGRVYDIDEPSPGLTSLRKITDQVRADAAA